jgi:hypothetical protein
LICSPGWPLSCNPPASASWVLDYRHVPLCLTWKFLMKQISPKVITWCIVVSMCNLLIDKNRVPGKVEHISRGK